MGCASSKVLPVDPANPANSSPGAGGALDRAQPAKRKGGPWPRNLGGRERELNVKLQMKRPVHAAAAGLSGAPGANWKAGGDYLKWRSRAACPPPAPPAELTADVLEQGAVVLSEITAHLATLGDKSPDMPTILSLMEPEADWSSFAHWQLARISAINQCAGPRVQVVWWGSIAKLRGFPRWPEDVGHVLDAEEMLKAYIEEMDDKGKVNDRIGCVAFLSHRWERPSADPSTAHPDSVDHKKAMHMAAVGKRGECATFVNHLWDLYYWVDYAGINQACPAQKYLGIAKLPGYIAASSEMIMYDSSTASYETRAWTRVERMLSFFYTWAPLFVYLSDTDPDDVDDSVDHIVQKSPSVYAKDPTQPDRLCMFVKDPLAVDAQLTDRADRDIIKKLTEACKGAVPYNEELRGLSSGEFRFGSSYIPLCKPRVELTTSWVSTISTASTACSEGEAHMLT